MVGVEEGGGSRVVRLDEAVGSCREGGCVYEEVVGEIEQWKGGIG